MAAFVANPKLPWDITEGGVIRLKGTTVTMQQLVNGRVTFDVINSHGETVTGRVVQYPSDQKYYIQADGSMLWKVGDISEATDTLVISASQTVQSGFTLADVHVNNLPVEFGFCLSNNKAYLAVKMTDDTLRVLSYEDKLPTGVLNDYWADFEFTPSPYTLGDHLEFVNNDNINDAPYDVLPCTIQESEELGMVIVVDNKQFEMGFGSGDETPLAVNDQLDV